MFEKHELIEINLLLIKLCDLFNVDHDCKNCKKFKSNFIHCSKKCMWRSIVKASKKIKNKAKNLNFFMC